MRNLDIAQLRALLAIEQYGGVGRAANMLNLTQSAVSMQIKRLEEALNVEVFSREGRKLVLTPSGEAVKAHARKMVSINDQLIATLAQSGEVKSLRLGIPPDITEPHLTNIINQFHDACPETRIDLNVDLSLNLRKKFDAGEMDIIVTTEINGDGKELKRTPLQWYIAEGATAHKIRPLPIATCQNCAFTKPVKKVLDASGIDYKFFENIQSDQVSRAMAKANMAVKIEFEGSPDTHELVVAHDLALPELPDMGIYIYTNNTEPSNALNQLNKIVEQSYRQG